MEFGLNYLRHMIDQSYAVNHWKWHSLRRWEEGVDDGPQPWPKTRNRVCGGRRRVRLRGETGAKSGRLIS